MNTELLTVQDLSCRYPKLDSATLNCLNFSLLEGESILILGPSGCGKSTLAQCIRGLIPQEMEAVIEGVITVAGHDPSKDNVFRLADQVFLIHQDPDAQIVSLMVEDDVAFALENLRIPPSEMRQRITTSLEWVGLSNLRNKETYNLSGGQKQRLGIASGLAIGSRLLLLDAPTSNLDPRGTQEIMETIHRLRSERGQTLLLIESKVDELIGMVDKVAIMGQDGSVLIQDEPRDTMRELLRGAYQQLGLRVPQIAEIFAVLQQQGVPIAELPLTVDEGEAELKRLLTAGEIRFEPDLTLTAEGDDADGETVVKLQNFSFTYPDGTQALEGPINLEIKGGDFVGIIGNNGGGKSTLCQNLAGLLRPTGGHIYLRGIDTSELSTREIVARIGYSFQQPARQMVANTCFDEIAYGLRIRDVPELAIQQRVGAMLEQFGLVSVKERHPLSLSMGQMRRLSVASMLVLEPDVFILDEPMQGLDRESQELLMGILAEVSNRGTTVIIVSHDMRTVAKYTNKTLLIDDGNVIYFGDTRHFFGDVLNDVKGSTAIIAPPVTRLAQRLACIGISPFTLTVSEFCRQVQPIGGTE